MFLWLTSLGTPKDAQIVHDLTALSSPTGWYHPFGYRETGLKDANFIKDDLAALQPGDLAVIGLPWDGSSSFLRGAAQAPECIRQAVMSPAGNLSTESGHDLATDPRFRLLGDLAIGRDQPLQSIERALQDILDRDARFLALGGDHAVTLGCLRACARHGDPLTLLHLDAHPDLYDEFEGDRFSHACVMARALEEGLVERVVQVGIRAATPHQRSQADRLGVEVIDARTWLSCRPQPLTTVGPVYVSIDLDVLDPAYAPGVSHPEPGGLSTRHVVEVIQGLTERVLAADIVELNPCRDLNGLTAIAAAKLLKELAATMLQAPQP